MGAGALLFVNGDNPKVSSYFKDGVDCVFYNSENLESLLSHYLANETERLKIAETGHARAHSEETFRDRAREIITALENAQPLKQRIIQRLPKPLRLLLQAEDDYLIGLNFRAADRFCRAAKEGAGWRAEMGRALCSSEAPGPADPTTALRAAVRTNPNEPLLWYNLGHLLELRGDLAGAQECYEKTLATLPNAPAVSFGGLAARADGHRFQSEWALAGYLTAGQGDEFRNRRANALKWRCRERMGCLAAKAGDQASAKLHLAKALQICPDNGYLVYELAQLARAAGNHSLAAELFSQAISQEPFFTQAQIGLLESLGALGKEEKAANLARHFLMVNPLLGDADSTLRAYLSAPPKPSEVSQEVEEDSAVSCASAPGDSQESLSVDLPQESFSEGPVPAFAQLPPAPSFRPELLAQRVAEILRRTKQSWSGLKLPGALGEDYAEYWAEWGDSSDRPAVYPVILKELFGGADKIVGKNILDIGCGMGTLLLLLQNSNRVFGVDSSDSGLDVARQHGLAVYKVDVSTQPLPFADDSFDLTFCLATIEHVSNPQLVLEEAKRVTVDGGYLVTSVPNPADLHQPRPFYQKLFEPAEFMDYLHVNDWFTEKLFPQGLCLTWQEIEDPLNRAEEFVFLCRNIKASNAPLHAKLGEDFLKNGRIIEGRDQILTAIRIDPLYAPAYRALASYYNRMNALLSRSDFFRGFGLDKTFTEAEQELLSVASDLEGESRSLSGAALEQEPAPATTKHATTPLAISERPPRLNILSTLWHEPFMTTLAQSGHNFTLLVLREGAEKEWRSRYRPLPSNISICASPQQVNAQFLRQFDLILGQTLIDRQFFIKLLSPGLPPYVQMLHCALQTEIGIPEAQLAEAQKAVVPLLSGIPLVYLSEKKAATWPLPGHIIPLAVDTEEFTGYTGDLATCLRVGNQLSANPELSGLAQLQALSEGYPLTILGDDSQLKTSAAPDFEALKSAYRSHRLYLNTVGQGGENGYNTATLEAMATGMPIVSIASENCPVKDGYNGFVSDDISYLRGKIKLLLADRDLAAALGQNARQTILEDFSLQRMLDSWNQLFAAVSAGTVPVAA
jgi:SAM-dependent methyltransferase/Flp pilus assembly protein TadD